MKIFHSNGLRQSPGIVPRRMGRVRPWEVNMDVTELEYIAATAVMASSGKPFRRTLYRYLKLGPQRWWCHRRDPLTQRDPRGRIGGFRTPVAHSGSVRAAADRGGD